MQFRWGLSIVTRTVMSWMKYYIHGNGYIHDYVLPNERLSVDGPKGISADSAAIYEHCEQASSERL